MVGVGKTTLETYYGLTLNPQSGGKVTASRGDGLVLSIQPNGSHEWRPAGTAGPFELATVKGSLLVYAYSWVGEARIFSLSLIDNVDLA